MLNLKLIFILTLFVCLNCYAQQFKPIKERLMATSSYYNNYSPSYTNTVIDSLNFFYPAENVGGGIEQIRHDLIPLYKNKFVTKSRYSGYKTDTMNLQEIITLNVDSINRSVFLNNFYTNKIGDFIKHYYSPKWDSLKVEYYTNGTQSTPILTQINHFKEYDSNNLLSLNSIVLYNGLNIDTSLSLFYKYFANKKAKEFYQKSNIGRYFYNYLVNNDSAKMYEEFYFNSLAIWQLQKTYCEIYDSNKNIKVWYILDKNNICDSLNQFYYQDNYYDQFKNLTKQLRKGYKNNVFDVRYRIYNDDNKLIEYIDSFKLDFYSNKRVVYKYNNLGLEDSIFSYRPALPNWAPNGITVINKIKINDTIVDKLSRSFYPYDFGPHEVARNEFDYNENGNIKQHRYYDFDYQNKLLRHRQTKNYYWEKYFPNSIPQDTLHDFNITLYPNPFQNDFQIIIDSKLDQQINFQFYNLAGQIVYNNNLQINKGIQNYNISIPNLPIGNYMLRVFNENNLKLYRMQKQ